MTFKKFILVFFLSLGCYFLEVNFLTRIFHPWFNIFLIVTLLLIFRKSDLWWPWFAMSLFFVWLGIGGWWCTVFLLTSLFAWWLRNFFSGSSRFWELFIFGLTALVFFLIILILPGLLSVIWPIFNSLVISWAGQWWLFFISHLILLLVGYWITNFRYAKY